MTDVAQQGQQSALERPRTDRETVKEMALQLHLGSKGTMSLEEAQIIAIKAGKRVRAKAKQKAELEALLRSLK